MLRSIKNVKDTLKLLRIELYVECFIMKCLVRVRGAARIARQPSKLKVLGSNPSGPAISPKS